MPRNLIAAARKLLTLCKTRGLKIATAESCTGGLLSATLTEIPGSSEVVDRGFVTYSNESKRRMLGVPARLLATYGAVSEQTARAMAKGALAHAPVHLAVGITGIAGPDGGTKTKPVGLVHIAAATRGKIIHRACKFGDSGRSVVREKSVLQALAMLTTLAAKKKPRKRTK